MAHEIVHTQRSKTLVRVVGNTTGTLITLADLSASPEETVKKAVIAQASAVSDGTWKIYRGDSDAGTLILELPQYAHFIFYEFDVTIANSSTSNVFITNTGSVGTLILQLGKDSIYNPPLVG